MRKFLQSPLAVVLMVVLAGWIVYQNVVQPLTKQPKVYATPISTTHSATFETHHIATPHAPLTWQPNPQDKNPFAKVAHRKQPKTKSYKQRYTVSAILSDDQQPLALINGQLVGVGDDINNFKVLSIKDNRISLHNGKKGKTLYLQQSFRR